MALTSLTLPDSLTSIGALGGRGGPRRHRAPRSSAETYGAPAPLVSVSTDFPIKYG